MKQTDRKEVGQGAKLQEWISQGSAEKQDESDSCACPGKFIQGIGLCDGRVWQISNMQAGGPGKR